MFSPLTWGSKGGGRPAREPPSPDAPDITVGPADALGQPRDPSSAASNTGGNTAPATALANERAASAPASGLVAVINECLAYITSLLQVLTSAGGPPGQLHVFLFCEINEFFFFFILVCFLLLCPEIPLLFHRRDFELKKFLPFEF